MSLKEDGYDKRIVRRNLEKGSLSWESYNEHLDGLPDLADKFEYVLLDEEEKEQEKEKVREQAPAREQAQAPAREPAQELVPEQTREPAQEQKQAERINFGSEPFE